MILHFNFQGRPIDLDGFEPHSTVADLKSSLMHRLGLVNCVPLVNNKPLRMTTEEELSQTLEQVGISSDATTPIHLIPMMSAGRPPVAAS